MIQNFMNIFLYKYITNQLTKLEIINLFFSMFILVSSLRKNTKKFELFSLNLIHIAHHEKKWIQNYRILIFNISSSKYNLQ